MAQRTQRKKKSFLSERDCKGMPFFVSSFSAFLCVLCALCVKAIAFGSAHGLESYVTIVG